MAISLSNLGPRTRKVLRYAGFALLGLVTFVFAFQLAFPFGRVKQRIIDALSDKYDVTIGDVERGFIPGRMYVKALTIRTRPAKADDVATTFYVEQLEVDLGLFALLHGTVSIPKHAGGPVPKSGRTFHIHHNWFRDTYSIEFVPHTAIDWRGSTPSRCSAAATRSISASSAR